MQRKKLASVYGKQKSACGDAKHGLVVYTTGVARNAKAKPGTQKRLLTEAVLPEPKKIKNSNGAAKASGSDLSIRHGCSAHRHFSSSCAQCLFKKNKRQWVAGHGSMRTKKNGAIVLQAWLQERLKPTWALGCAACAQLLARANMAQESSVRHIRRRFSTKWARFEITALSQMQSCAFANHAGTDIHKLAVQALQKPDLPLVSLLPEREEDKALLAGSVPQPEDFLKAWRCVKSPVSFLKASMHSHTDFFITGHKRVGEGVERRASSASHRNIIYVCLFLSLGKFELEISWILACKIVLILFQRLRISAMRIFQEAH